MKGSWEYGLIGSESTDSIEIIISEENNLLMLKCQLLNTFNSLTKLRIMFKNILQSFQ